MPFDELLRGHQIPDPEARKAEDILRSGKKKRKRKGFRTSVKLSTIKTVVVLMSLIFGLAVVSGVGYLIYLGFQLYTQS